MYEECAVSFRVYETRDRDACIDVCRGNVPKFIAEEEVVLFSRFIDEQVPSSCRYVVGRVDGAVVACGGLARDGERQVATMCWGLVQRSWHGRGLGSALLVERMAWLSREELQAGWKFELQTSQHTYRFFEKFGFRVGGITPNGFGGGLDKYEMSAGA